MCLGELHLWFCSVTDSATKPWLTLLLKVGSGHIPLAQGCPMGKGLGRRTASIDAFMRPASMPMKVLQLSSSSGRSFFKKATAANVTLHNLMDASPIVGTERNPEQRFDLKDTLHHTLKGSPKRVPITKATSRTGFRFHDSLNMLRVKSHGSMCEVEPREEKKHIANPKLCDLTNSVCADHGEGSYPSCF